MLGAAAVPQPAHQRRVPARHLHAIDAEVVCVVPVLVPGPPRHHQGPGDERRRFARPAGLDRQAAEIDRVALQRHVLARRPGRGLGLHRQGRFEHRPHVHRLTPSARRLRLLEEGQHVAELAQIAGFAVHAERNALDGAEEVDQDRHVEAPSGGPDHGLEEDGRATLGQQPGLNLGHFELGRDRFGDAHQLARLLQAFHEVSEARIGHGAAPSRRRPPIDSAAGGQRQGRT